MQTFFSWLTRLALAAVLTVLPGQVLTGQSQLPVDAELVRQLVLRVGQLELELRELKAARGDALAAVAAPPPVAGPALKTPAAEEISPTVAQAAHSMPAGLSAAPVAGSVSDPHVEHEASSAWTGRLSDAISIRGFGDIGYSSRRPQTGTGSFSFGQLDIFAIAKLSDKVSFLLETVVESSAETNASGIEVERAVLRYRPNRFFNAEVGRFHTSIGYYNTTFHHGRWFQTAIDRPAIFLMEDGGGLLPIHNVGLNLSGQLPSGPLGLEYVAELANGRAYPGPGVEPVQNIRDENNGKAVNLGLIARPRFAPGWQFGVSAYTDRLARDGVEPLRQWIFAVHAVYNSGRLELLNEFVDLRHSGKSLGAGSVVTSIPALYSQVAWRVAPGWRPYVRYQFMNANPRDPIAGALQGAGLLKQAWTFGLRYDLTEYAALKTQFDRVERSGESPHSEASVNISFTFPRNQ